MFKRLFGGLSMPWWKVLLFAGITGVYTGLINQVPVLYDTSFRDIAINLECWILFAVVIAVNCQTSWEAALKTFVFFLVSQPLVYLVETPFLGLSVWGHYRYWFFITLLTLPGGALAYYSKKQTVYGALILSMALVLLAGQGAQYVYQAVTSFPHHLLSAIFCFGQIVLLLFALRESARQRMLPAVLAGLATVVFLGVFFIGVTESSASIPLPPGTWQCELEDSRSGRVVVEDGALTYYSAKTSKNQILCTGEDGSTITYTVTVSPDHLITITEAS